MQRHKNVDLITEELFREAYQYEEVKRPPLKKLIADCCRCSKNTFCNLFPIAKWLPNYMIREYLLSDVISGMTVAIMHISHGLAYAPLGRVEPVVGFYMAIFPVFIYMIMGTSRHISIGTFAVVCAMAGQVVAKHEIPESVVSAVTDNSTNVTAGNVTTTAEPQHRGKYEPIQVAVAICLLVGAWQSLLGLLRLGSLTVVMSESLVGGFTTGAAVHVFSYQLKNLFGVKVAPFSGAFKLIYIYIDFFSKIKTTNLVTLYISGTCIAVLLFFNECVKPFLQKRFPKNKIPIPIELVVIFVGILASYFGHFSQNYNVSIVNHIPTGFPKPILPPFPLLPALILDSFIISIVAVAINISLAKIFAKKGEYDISGNQDILAYGISNIFSAWFSCLPSAASLSRTSIQYSVGGKTQLASCFSIFLMSLILLFAGSWFEPVPYCVLSSIVVVTLKGLLMQIVDLPRIWKSNTMDGIVWLGTFLAVVILDLDYGLGVGIVLSLFAMGLGFYEVQALVLGRVPNTSVFLPLDYYKAAKAVPNILILEIVGGLNFANSSRLESLITKSFRDFSGSVTAEESYLVLNMISVTQVDPTSIRALIQMNKYLKNSKCNLYLTDCNIRVYRTFQNCNIFKHIPQDHVLASVADAVEYLSSKIEQGPRKT